MSITPNTALRSLALPAGDELVLVLRGISKSFNGAPALADVSLNVRAGEVHALLGENGAGKSTLMNVASGALRPDAGEIEVSGETVDSLTPRAAAQHGIAIVHQHPAVLPDLTVLENFEVALPRSVFAGGDTRRTTAELLACVRLDVHLDERVERLSVAQKHLLEIAKALAVQPRILVLDEPTAPLGSDSVDLLFGLVRDAVARGTAIIYITHRMAEVRDLANRVTVLRDGKVARADVEVEAVTDEELLALIVGRRLASTFPPKNDPSGGTPNLVVDGLSGPGFDAVSFTARAGDIVGIAGVVGNGQVELIRTLAGLSDHSGSVTVNDRKYRARDLLKSAGYMPADRHREGLMMRFSVRENAAIASLGRYLRGPFLSRRAELRTVQDELGKLSVKAPSLDAPVSALSGGNQQKIVMARTVLGEPHLVLADEPTQGVDVGARAEIYRILREISSRGAPVVVASSDSKELEGLCDKVLVMSRGQVVSELVGDEIDEERMVHVAVSARTETIKTSVARTRSTRLSRFLRGDYPPVLLLAAVMIGLGAFVLSQNANYLNAFNLNSMMMSITALGFIALGQTIPLILGGIDLSVGPLAGLLVVIASFLASDGSTVGSILLGFAAMVLVSIVVGLVNGSLVRFAKFTAIAATLAMYIALQGVSFILRPATGGSIDTGVMEVLGTAIGPVPVVFIVLVAVAVALEVALRRTRWGWRLRAVGSDEPNARRVGIDINRTVIAGYVSAAVLTFLGAGMLMEQIGVGDPAQGVSYTLTSITAVVLGGTSVFGGRGTFLGSVLGAALLVQVLNATVFLRLDQMWQYFLQGLLILLAIVVYGAIRGKRPDDAAH
ncbi:ATP-binding cassette domain-containing protein [Micromonospora sp. NPDC048830]|uniref:ATP-binding cassette domain-containing protein n=1 Tax=Micromonospora sp. NPDC048830 TaxID=3364257 RepID=UPI0037198922